MFWVLQKIIELVFFATNRPHDVSPRNKVNDVDSIIQKIKYSHMIPKHASQLKNLSHGMVLRNATFLLLKKEVSSNDIQTAQESLSQFLIQFSEKFGEHNMTPNFHDLEHLADCVRRSGPLYEFSGFNFEHVNGLLKNLAHGNKRVDKQIIKKLNEFASTVGGVLNANQDIIDFAKSLESNKSWKKQEKVNDDLFMCGKKCQQLLKMLWAMTIYFSVKRMIIGN